MVRAMDLSSSPPTTTTTTKTPTTTTPDTDSPTPPPPPPPPLFLPQAQPIKSLSFTINGSLNRHQPPPPQQQQMVVSYRECLKNHAASIGGHALDGCGEFMPSPSALPSDPTSLKCAACGCHRNFHRRHPEALDHPKSCHVTTFRHHHHNNQLHLLPSPPFPPPRRRNSNSSPSPSPSPARSSSPGPTPSPTPSPHSPPPVSHLPPNSYFASPPQMLLALSSGLSRPSDYQYQNYDPTVLKSGTTDNINNSNNISNARKRFRTKFSQEQKEKMCLFAEKLGWKMQRSEEKVVEEFCNEVGIRKGVLKVWMHNNKHTLGKRLSSSSSSISHVVRNNGILNHDNAHEDSANHDSDEKDEDLRKANFNFFANGSSSSS